MYFIRMIITIDGKAAAGKSTIAKLVAEELCINHINTGLIYRGIVCQMLIKMNNASTILNRLGMSILNRSLVVDMSSVDENSKEFMKRMQQVADNPELREKINKKVRTLVGSDDAVIEGRDCGLLTFPNADAKFYITAPINARAKRRFDKFEGTIPLNKIIKNLAARDAIDHWNRFLIPSDSVVIDTSIFDELATMRLIINITRANLIRPSDHKE